MSEGAEDRLKTTRNGLRAVFAADITGFTGAMAVNQSAAISAFNEIRAVVAQQLQAHEGWLCPVPGAGLFALFESAVNAVRCALETQRQLGLRAADIQDMRLRIGIHLGDVLFEKDLPHGETLSVAARLEDLADPGGILVSAAVMDVVSARISATFEERGTQDLKNIPRRIVTFAVMPAPERAGADETRAGMAARVRPAQSDRDVSPPVRDQQFSGAKDNCAVQPAGETTIVRERPAIQAEAAARESASGERPAASADPSGAKTQANVAAAKPPVAPAPAERAHDASARAAHEPPPAQPIPAPPPASAVAEAPEASALPAESAGYRPTEECVESLIAALAVHLGPFAKVLVNRMVKKSSDADHLVSLLEEQIQSKEERSLFHIRASHICQTFANRQSDDS